MNMDLLHNRVDDDVVDDTDSGFWSDVCYFALLCATLTPHHTTMSLYGMTWRLWRIDTFSEAMWVTDDGTLVHQSPVSNECHVVDSDALSQGLCDRVRYAMERTVLSLV